MLDNQIDYKLWNVGWDMWEHWNGALHNCLQVQQHIVVSQINDQIWAYYLQVPQALPQDTMHFMSQHMEHQLNLLLAAKQQWLNSVEVAIAWKFCHNHGNYLAEQWFMQGQVTGKGKLLLLLNLHVQTRLRGTFSMRVSEIGNDNPFLLFQSFHHLVQPRLKWGD